MKQFEVSIDNFGNIGVEGGVVIDMRSSPPVFWTVGGSVSSSSSSLPSAIQGTLVGGGGDCITVAGTLSEPVNPLGVYARRKSAKWENLKGFFVEVVSGTTYLTDGSDVIATGSSSGSSPVGTLTSTTYGETQYNGGIPFTLVVTRESGQRENSVHIAAQTTMILGGDYMLINYGEWWNGGTPGITLKLNDDGTAYIYDGTDIIAERINPLEGSPDGAYASTTYGADNYNDGIPFTAYARLGHASPAEGYAYMTLVNAGTHLTGVIPPVFETTLPASTSTHEHVPIAYSYGDGRFIQLQEGTIIWR